MDFDIIIIGGGPVGASFALALASARVRVALIEPNAKTPAISGDWDARIYAVSPGSATFLESMGAWQQRAVERIATISDMRIFGNDEHAAHLPELDFSAYDAGVSELAFTMEGRELQRILWSGIARASYVQVIAAQGKALAFDEHAAQLTLNDGRTLRAQLIVGADGADSWTRTQANIEVGIRAYNQAGVVANFKTEKPHRGVAYQWFRDDGVLAYLPLASNSAENQISIVWSTPDEHAKQLLARAPQALSDEVAMAGHHALGALQLETPAQAFPLRVQYVKNMVAHRLALIGDAAHGVHPLAGQGVNLGFRDARALAQVLAQRGPAECGEFALLRKYERARREDVLATQFTTDALQRAFASKNAGIARARNAGLRSVNRLQTAKQFLVRRAVA